MFAPGFLFCGAAWGADYSAMTVSPLGDSAVVITVGETVDAATTARVRAVAAEIQSKLPAGVVDVVPAFGRVAVFFDPTEAAEFDVLRAELEQLALRAEAAVQSLPSRTVEIPV